uniref:Uncharacterized protein n=1 Tax=Setaria italica TaxID=4555 RepID=K3Y4G3_SETIT
MGRRPGATGGWRGASAKQAAAGSMRPARAGKKMSHGKTESGD